MQKRVIVLLGIISAALAIICVIQYVSLSKLKEEISHLEDTNRPKHPIEIEFETEMLTWSGVTGEGVDIICKYGDLWKNEMEKYYDLLFDILEPEKRQWLESSQKQWEIFTKEHEELSWQTYDQMHHGGSIMRIFEAHIYYERYKDRAMQLMALYGTISTYIQKGMP